MTKKKKPEDLLPVGRPEIYNKEFGEYVCEMIATHTDGLVTLCKKYSKMPHHETIASWLFRHPEFSVKYREARLHRTTLQAEEMIDLAEVETYIDEKGIERVDAGRVNLQKLKINTRQWTASKLLPKIYGDKLGVEELKGQNEELKEQLLKLQAELLEKNKKEY